MNKFYLILVAAVTLVILSAFGVRSYTAREHSPVCVAGPGEECPNDYFSHRVHVWQQANKEAEDLRMHGTIEEYEDKTAYVTGLSNQLFATTAQGGMTPDGYQWNTERWKFVKVVTSAPLPTVANPIPAPPATADKK